MVDLRHKVDPLILQEEEVEKEHKEEKKEKVEKKKREKGDVR